MSAPETTWTADEMLAVAAARALRDGQVCVVGEGVPARAAELARRLHAPGLVVVPDPGGGTATGGPGPVDLVNYWLQGGRVDVGMLTVDQVDVFGNVNTSLLGEPDEPDAHLAGAGSAPEIAASSREVVLVLPHRAWSFVTQVDFVTAVGRGSGPGDREALGLRGGGPSRVVTDLGVLEPDPDSGELVLTALHTGVTVAQAVSETGWDLEVSADLRITAPPSAQELTALREIARED